MAEGSGRAALGRKVLAPVVAVGVLAVGAHLWLNTDLFAGDTVCGGLVSTDAADAVFPSSGRVSDRDGLDERPGDRLSFDCTVESSSFLPGTDTGRIRVSAARERGDFPFTDDGRWPNPATASFFSGGAGGAVGGIGADHGWVLLPARCTTQAGPAVVEGYAPEGSGPVEFARLLTDVATRAAERAGCLTGGPLVAPAALPAAPAPRPVRDGAVCGIEGLGFPGPGGRTPGTGAGTGSGAVKETVTGAPGESGRPTWACEVEGYATYAVTREPRIVEGIRASTGFTTQPPVAGRPVSGFDTRHVVADCAGVPTYFSMEFGRSYQDAADAPGTPRRQDLFDDFVEAAGKRLGCSAPTS
ncbi:MULTISPECIES: hypothetical protein [unclassified Streptomyces]|uniref:hypothetical protein n=1 Tax=unclassified Streptomyces TaxID=2593676 RepID=UPI0006F45462|nr:MULTISPECIES: hypothetical protein [unclassified Streptomyces]KQX57967.1 hypothetical protein ASD33_26130 [Streptomyces sp. Root1304]KRA85631.1 hypothetical protein ASE09_33525 [Streptomyces sp. Root66D1]